MIVMVVTDDSGNIVLTAVYVGDGGGNVLLLKKTADGSLEPPGGKLETTDCKDYDRCGFTQDDLMRCAVRELFEELGQGFIVEELESLGRATVRLPDGATAVVYGFSTTILFGTPVNNEPEVFSEFSWESLRTLVKRADLSFDVSHFASSLLKNRV